MMRIILIFLTFLFVISGCTNLFQSSSETAWIFPEAMAPHREFKTEWWYQTGLLNSGKLAYEITFFRMYDPESSRWPHFLGLPLSELWVIHLMIHDYDSDKRYFREWLIFPPLLFWGSGVFTCQDRLCLKYETPNLKAIWMGDQREMKVEYQDENVKLKLDLRSNKKPVWHNGGIVPMVEGNSYYYSITDVEVSGTLAFQGKNYEVQGSCWIDQQWGNFDAKPWEWYSIRLDNGVEIMLYSFPGRNVGFGTVVYSSGETQSLTIDDFQMTFEGTGTDLEGDEIRIPTPGWVSIQKLDAKLEIKAKSPEQLNPSKYTPQYWEGLCTTEGTFNGIEVKGWAFYETWH